MLKLISITAFLISVTIVYAQLPVQQIPTYVMLPQMPTNPTPPSPGQPSSYSIDKIRNRRGAINSTKTAFSSSSSEDKEPSTLNRSPGKNQKLPTKEDPMDDDGKVRIQPLMAQHSFDEIPASPATYRYIMDQKRLYASTTESNKPEIVEEKMSKEQKLN